MNCPVCGAKDGTCTGHAPFDPSKVFDIAPKAIISGGMIAMPAKAVEPQGKDRYPQQHVRPGRGVPGYTGDVEVYPTEAPASYGSGDGGAGTLAAAETNYASMKVDDLRAALASRDLPVEGNKGDLIARLEDADKA